MADSYVPKTIQELENWMKENCFNFNSYSINGNAIFEGFGIQRSGDQFVWFYTERGQQNNLQQFQSESEITTYAFLKISMDKWANTHCIGFTKSKDEKQEIADILEDLAIAYFQDDIPNYYSLNTPAYRTFVSGCDIKKAMHLKKKYYIEQ